MKNLLELRQRAQTEREGLRAARTCIAIDTGTFGAAAGSLAVAERLQSEAVRLGIDLSIKAMGSLGCNEIQPVVSIAQPGRPRIYYANVDAALAAELVATLADDRLPSTDKSFAFDAADNLSGLPTLASLPFFAGQQRVGLRRVGLIDPEDLNDALVHGAYAGLEKALALSPQEVTDIVERTGLHVRGSGASAAGKWRACRSAPGQRSLIADAACGFQQAGSYDLLLEGDPHAVLEGTLIAAYAAGADRAFLCIDPGSTTAIQRLDRAIAQLRAAQLLGTDILGSGYACEIEVRLVPRRLNAAEDTILIAALEGRQPQARLRPPEPETTGLFGGPTVVQDVESLALVAPLLTAETGSSRQPETMVVQLSGTLARTGFVEVPLGTPLRTIVEKIAGGPSSQTGLKAVQIGGPAGGFIPASALETAWGYEALNQAGCALLSGYLFAVANDCCAVDLARQASAAAHIASCGKCSFGREGTRQLKDVLADIARGSGKPTDIDLLLDIGDCMKAASLCPNGAHAPDAFLTALRHFRGEFDTHLNARQCPAGVCTKLLAGQEVAQ